LNDSGIGAILGGLDQAPDDDVILAHGSAPSGSIRSGGFLWAFSILGACVKNSLG
jgi:hypothetical protein